METRKQKNLEHQVISVAFTPVCGQAFQDEVMLGLKEAFRVIEDYIVVHEYLVQYLNDEIDFDDAALIILDFTTNCPQALGSYSAMYVSTDSTITKYLKINLERFDAVNKELQRMLDDDKEFVKGLDERVCLVIAGFVDFIINDFQLYTTLECIENEEPLSTDVIFRLYCRSEAKIAEEVGRLFRLHSEYKPRLEFFDEYPELELPFEKLMGPSMVVIDESMETIDENIFTLDFVKSVIDGTITPFDALVKLGLADEDDEPVSNDNFLQGFMNSF